MPSAPNELEPLLSKRELARQLGVGTSVVEKLMRDGQLPYLRFSVRGAVRFRPADVAAFVQRRLERRTPGATTAADFVEGG